MGHQQCSSPIHCQIYHIKNLEFEPHPKEHDSLYTTHKSPELTGVDLIGA